MYSKVVLAAGLAAAVTPTLGDVYSPQTNNATVVITQDPILSNVWDVEITQGTNCCALVWLDSDDTNDIIRTITIFNNPDNFDDQVSLTIRDSQARTCDSRKQVFISPSLTNQFRPTQKALYSFRQT